MAASSLRLSEECLESAISRVEPFIYGQKHGDVEKQSRLYIHHRYAFHEMGSVASKSQLMAR